jgi:hypothetical protein
LLPSPAASRRSLARRSPPHPFGNHFCAFVGDPISAAFDAAVSAQRGITTTLGPSSTSADHQGHHSRTSPDAELIIKLDDPALFNYPIALMWEPGLNLTDREAESFRAYPFKGGFAIFEDSTAPSVERVRVTDAPRAGSQLGSSRSRTRFDPFFRIGTSMILHRWTAEAALLRHLEGNDPSRRLMVGQTSTMTCPNTGMVGRFAFPVRRPNEAC